MLNFLAGMACGVLLMMAAVSYVTRPAKRSLTFLESYDRAKRLKGTPPEPPHSAP